jgi:rubredoxin
MARIRCKACGFIADEDSIKDVCPACGVPKTAFEPYEDRVAVNRRRWIERHIHPILVHFPQGITLLILGTIILAYPLGGILDDTELLMQTPRYLAVLLPFAVVAGFVSGVVDGKIRFKSVTTPYLKIKTITAILFLVVSSTLAFVAWNGVNGDNLIVVIVLNVITIICSVVLGKIGGELTCSAMGGK